MGTYSLGVPVTEGSLYPGAVSANVSSHSGVVGAVEYVSWSGLDDDEDDDVYEENDEGDEDDEEEGGITIVAAAPPVVAQRKPVGRPRKAVKV